MTLLLFCLINILIAPSAQAANNWQVSPAVEQVLNGGEALNDVFSYRLAPEGGGPEGNYDFTIKGNDSTQVGPLNYSAPGIYYYTLRCITPSKSGYSIDKSVYNISVYVTSDSSKQPIVTIKKVGAINKTNDIKFQHTYTSSTGGGESANYTVRHYLVSSGGTTLSDTETLTGTVGASVTAIAKSYTGYTYNSGHAGTVKSGVVLADGSLVLRLYYEINKYTVTFRDWNGNVIKTQTVEYGKDATAPANPKRSGYTFTGWDKPSSAWHNVKANVTVTAKYKKNSSGGGGEEEDNGGGGGNDDTDTGGNGGGNSGGGIFVTNVTNVTNEAPNYDDETTHTEGTGSYIPDTTNEPNNGVPNNEIPNNIVENPVPESPSDNNPVSGTAAWSLFDLICAVIGVAAAIAALIVLILRRKDDEDDRDYYESEDETYYKRKTRRYPLFVLSIIFAIALVLLFILTQDISLPMAFFDNWSIVFAVGAICGIISARLTFGKKKEKLADESAN
jgi:pilin isopeptide linkage protein/uncharacterized repeat protein (TIGR02543 family)